MAKTTNCSAEKESFSWIKIPPSYTKTQRIYAYIMLVLVFVESSFLFLQAGKAYRTKSTADLDLTAFIILLISNVMWIVYAFWLIKDRTLMISAILYVIGAILIIVAILMYS